MISIILGISILLIGTSVSQAATKNFVTSAPGDPEVTEALTLDELEASTILANSSDATEIAWIKEVLGVQVGDEFTYVKRDDLTQSDVITSVDETAQAIMLPEAAAPGSNYFLLKYGTGEGSNPVTPTHYLFQNNEDLLNLVWLLADVNELISLSHVALADYDDGEGEGPIPLPAAVWLFGSGLIGMLGFSRKSKSVINA